MQRFRANIILVPGAVLLALASVGSAQQADALLHVRPGQSVAENLGSWSTPCADFVLTEFEGEENYLTCVLGPDEAVTANVTPDGVIWWSRFWGAGGLDRDAFVARQRRELGLEGDPAACFSFDDPAECWNLTGLEVTIPIAQVGGGWAVILQDPALQPQQ